MKPPLFIGQEAKDQGQETGEQKQVSRTINQNRLDNFRKHLQLLLSFDLSYRGHTYHGVKQILHAQAMRDPYCDTCCESMSKEEVEEWVEAFYFDIYSSVLTAEGKALWLASAPEMIEPEHIETKYLDVNEVLSTLPNDVLPASVISIAAKGKVDIQHCIQERGYVNNASILLKAEWGTPHNSRQDIAMRAWRALFLDFMVDCVFDGVDEAELKYRERFAENAPDELFDSLKENQAQFLQDPAEAEFVSMLREKGREHARKGLKRFVFETAAPEADETEYSQWFSLVDGSVNDPYQGDWQLYCLAT